MKHKGLFDIITGGKEPSVLELLMDIATSDPGTDGKKAGYERASKEYEPIYRELKSEYEQAIEELRRQNELYTMESDAQIRYLEQLENKRDALQKRINQKSKKLAAEHGISVFSLKRAVARPDVDWDPLIWLISDSLERKRRMAEKEGYLEAKRHYEEKLKDLRCRFEEEKANMNRQLRKHADLISEILIEIENTQMKIADMEIILQRD